MPKAELERLVRDREQDPRPAGGARAEPFAWRELEPVLAEERLGRQAGRELEREVERISGLAASFDSSRSKSRVDRGAAPAPPTS